MPELKTITLMGFKCNNCGSQIANKVTVTNKDAEIAEEEAKVCPECKSTDTTYKIKL